ncbi:MAG TPA: ABC transporter substrate-binding protein, partial [Vineibacter sp.]|nr:ABC transporter substrate-binding protein [Vineibacter sp.]
DGQPERLPALINELLAASVEILVVSGSDATFAAVNAVSDRPLVFASSAGYDAAGPVNFARPGRNLTGIVLQFDDVAQKWPELLKQAAPRIRRAGIVHDRSPSNVVQVDIVERGARSLGLATVAVPVESGDALLATLDRAKRGGADAFILVSSPIFTAAARAVTLHVAELGIPAIYESRVMTRNGGLMSFGPSFEEVFHLLAESVDRAARGAKPGDLPIQRPTRFELAVNLGAARALGLELPQVLLVRADEVIE